MAEVLHPELPVLIVDDESIMLKSFKRVLNFAGINNVILCEDSREVMPIVNHQKIGLILLDLLMPHISGEELLDTISNEHPEIPVIIITGVREVETAVHCMRANAYDYLVKPIDEDRLITAIGRAIEYREMREEIKSLRQRLFSDELKHPEYFENIVTQNREMLSIFRYIEAIAISSQSVLITGETGVGKESIAEAIHRCSQRKGELVKVSIAGLDDTLFSDTLFGHVRGAFTDAKTSRKGLVEKAANGTLFLDEIGDLDIKSQIKLLRLIQEQEYFPLGSDEARRSHARILVATNKNLTELVNKDHFRKDLYYRLNSHKITVPPLRARLDDLPLLVQHFVNMAAKELKKDGVKVPENLVNTLATYNFPGNIRELKAMIFDAVARSHSQKINISYFADYIRTKNQDGDTLAMNRTISHGSYFAAFSRLPTLKQATAMLINEALKRTDGNKTIAAQMLGITRQTIIKYIKEE